MAILVGFIPEPVKKEKVEKEAKEVKTTKTSIRKTKSNTNTTK